MPVKKAYAYDSISGRFLGRVPLSWFDTFEHVQHCDENGERPDVPKTPKGTARKRPTETPGDTETGSTKEASDGIA